MVSDSGFFSGSSCQSCNCTSLPGRLHAEDIQSAQHLNADSMDGLDTSIPLSPFMLSSSHTCMDTSHTRLVASHTWLDASHTWMPHNQLDASHVYS